MKRILWYTSLLIFLLTANNFPQNIYSEQPAASIAILPDYENWHINDSTSFSEFTSVLSAGINPLENTSIGLVARYASVTGDLSSLSGVSDMQLIVKQRLPDQNLIFEGGLNIPTGKTKLKPDEFITSRIISQELFSLRTSNFGQGLNAFVGVTWLHPLSDKVVIGTGISYQVKSEYQPLSDSPVKYTPSNEVSVTAGLDLKMSETQTISGDVTGIFYGSDKVDGKDIFSSGNRIVVNVMYRQFFGFNFLSVYGLYRNVALDKLKGPYALLENEKITPNETYLGVLFSQRFSSQFSLGYGVFASFYEKTAGYFSGYTLYGANLSPEFMISPSVSLPLQLKYAIGNASGKTDLSNYEISVGIRFNL